MSGARVFKITVPSGSNLYSLSVATHTHSACKIPTPPGQAVGATYTFTGAVNTKPVVTGVDHLQIDHDGSGRTCGAKAITIRACADAGCTSLYTLSTTVTLTATSVPAGAATWAPLQPMTFSGGTATVQLTKSAPATVTVGGSITSPAPKGTGTTCSVSGTIGSCDIVFSAASCSLDAVEVGKNPATPIYTKIAAGTFSLDVLSLNGSGVLANSTATIKAQLVEEAGCTGATPTVLSPEVPGTFSGNRLSYTFAPSKASKSARVRIVNGAVVGCSYDRFAIRPASFTVTTVATGTTGSAGADATGASGSALPVLKAGTAIFILNANGGSGYSGTPGFNNFRVAAADVVAAIPAPPGGTAVPAVPGTVGTLDFDASVTGFGAAASGIAAGSFKYFEVGYFRLLPFAVYDDGNYTTVDSSVGDCLASNGSLQENGDVTDPNIKTGGMVGCYFGNTTSQYFGRFIPDRFTAGAVSLTNRAALTTCVAPAFSYIGEAMQAVIPLTAVAADGEPTFNYTGMFDRLKLPAATQLGVGAVNDVPGTRQAIPLCGATPASPCLQAGTVSNAFKNGVASFGLPLTFFRPAAPALPFGPFELLKIGVAPADLDAVKLDPAAFNIDTVTEPTASPVNNHVLLGTTKARYGRLNVDNAYGSELLNLSMRVSAQYYRGTGYTTNTLDSCTPLASTDFTLVDYRRGITPANMDAGHVTGGTMVGGVGRVVLAKPTPAPSITGSVVLKSNNTTTLPGSGRGTFGVYKAGPVIYVRETY